MVFRFTFFNRQLIRWIIIMRKFTVEKQNYSIYNIVNIDICCVLRNLIYGTTNRNKNELTIY